MAGGLEVTFSVLAKTQNEAAVRVLLGALDVSDRSVQIGVLRALLARRSATGQRELLRRWHTLGKRWKSIVADSGGRLSNAIRDAVLSPDEQLQANGCDAVLTLREYDLIPALITAAEEKSNPRAERSAETLLLLADALCEELVAPRDYQNRRDPHAVRAHVAGALERSVERFDHHKRREIVEAFLMLAGHENPALNHILQHPHDKAYVTLVHLLSHSSRPGVMRLILDSLDAPRAPSAIYSILARRKDVNFVRHMLKRFADAVPKTAENNLKHIDSFSWLRDDMNSLSALNGEEQRGAIHLAMASGMSRIRVFEVVDFILTHGAAAGRQEAARVLAEFRGAEASATVIRALKDDDPMVRAIAVSQLRERGIRGALKMLFELVDSPDELVREAARESLAEFTFERFLAIFGSLDDEMLAETGQLVKRIDPNALDGLRNELKSPLRVRRIRAIQMAVAMTAVAECESFIIALLFDDDHVIRVAAADALVQSPSVASRNALRDAILDRSQLVRDAAERTLQVFAEHEVLPRSAAGPLPLDLRGSLPASETGEAVS
ncbi:MAG: HEAT repeat domain-containing protein [Planctomycetota bacterium]|nr:HEAT repeat domain-containing protein [Planctomycetota bacterium]